MNTQMDNVDSNTGSIDNQIEHFDSPTHCLDSLARQTF